jgi:hypothetical protein
LSPLDADVIADLIAWAATTPPAFVISHLLLKRHVTRVANAQTRDLKGGADDGTGRPA